MRRNTFTMPHDRHRNGKRSGLKRHSTYAMLRHSAYVFTASAENPVQIPVEKRHSTCANHVTAHTLADLRIEHGAFRYRMKSKKTSSLNHSSLIKEFTRLQRLPAQYAMPPPHPALGRQGARFEGKNIDKFTFKSKNIAMFSSECKRIQNFRFHYVVTLSVNTRSSRNRKPNHEASPPIFSVAVYARSRGVKGPPLPTQFGGAKLYRG
jgi:hypothetical protein